MFRFSGRRARAVSLAAVLAASSLAVIGGSPVDAATGSNLYQLTCGGNIAGTNTGPIPTPIRITSTSITPDPAFPTGTAVQVTGDVEITVLGALQAGLLAAGLSGNVSFKAGSSIEVTATNTGTANTVISLETTTAPMNGRVITGGITTTAGGTTVTSAGGFLATDVGAFISTSPLAPVPGLAAGSVIIAFISANEVVINQPALTSATGAAGAVAKDVVFTLTGRNLGSYVSAGASGDTMQFSLAVGGATGLIVELGAFTGTFNQTNPWGLPTPPNPPAGCFVSAGSFGSTTLTDPAPVPVSQTLNVGTSSVTPITLTAPDSDPTPATTFTIVTLPLLGALTVGGNPAVAGASFALGLPVVYTAGPNATVESFTFSASDGVSSSAADGTITINVGTPPVQQPITQEITPGQLVLSCNAPGTAGYPDASCPAIAFQSVQLNGTNQSSTRAMNQIHVSDNRGNVAVGWSLTSYVINQPITGGGTFKGLVNTNAGADTSLAANRIEASYLSIGGITCTAVSPAPAAALPPGGGGTYAITQPLCSAAAGSSIGHFTVDGTFTLVAPSSKAAGNYSGTVEYLVI